MHDERDDADDEPEADELADVVRAPPDPHRPVADAPVLHVARHAVEPEDGDEERGQPHREKEEDDELDGRVSQPLAGRVAPVHVREELRLGVVELVCPYLLRRLEPLLHLGDAEGARHRAEDRQREHDQAFDAAEVLASLAQNDEPDLEERIQEAATLALLRSDVPGLPSDPWCAMSGSLVSAHVALSTRKREPRQARKGATVAWKGVAGPFTFWSRGSSSPEPPFCRVGGAAPPNPLR